MSRGQGVTLTLPSGHSVSVSTRYRYAWVVDANAGSWVERRSDSLKVIRNGLRQLSPALWTQSHVYDTTSGEEVVVR